MNFAPFAFQQQVLSVGPLPPYVTDNLVIYYAAGNTSSYPGTGTDWFNLQPTGLTQTLTNGPTFSSANGGLIVFDGTNDYSTGADSALVDFGTGDWTIECWIVINANAAANNDGNKSATIVNALNKTGTYNGWNFVVRGDATNTGQALIFERQINSTGTYPRYTLPAPAGQSYITKNILHQVGMSHSAANGTKFFIDGVNFNADLNLTGNVNGTNALELARLAITGYQQYFNGSLSAIRIYNGKQLSNAELAQNFNTNFNNNIVRTGLVLNYDAGNMNSYLGNGTSWTNLETTSLTSTLTNGPTFSTNNGGTIVFDGTNDYTTRAADTNFVFGTGDFTVEAWVKIVGNSSQNNDGIRDAQVASSFPDSGGDINNSWGLQINGNSTTTGTGLSFGCRNSTGTFQRPTVNFTFTQGVFYQIGITHRSGVTNFFINGVLYAASVNLTNNINNTTRPFKIGGLIYPGYTQYLNGTVGIVRIYKGKGLTSDEVLQNYNAGINRI